MEKKTRKHTAEFKQGAVELSRQLGSVVQAAHQLGISENLVYAWRARPEFGAGPGQPPVTKSAEQLEIERLRKENGELKKVNQILKHAAAFFSQDHLK